jgi:hypothetical protein
MGMMKMNEYQIASIVGCVIAISWIVAYFLCWTGQWAWAWVDDSKVGSKNLIIDFLTKRAGYTDRDSCVFPYYTPDGDSADGTWLFVRALLITSLAPMLSVLCVKFYPVALFALLFLALAWATRFSRRHKKLFDKHIVDKDAHN